jgi:hypothetical protein
MWRSSRNFYKQPRACFRSALSAAKSFLSHLLTVVSYGDCASEALAETLLPGVKHYQVSAQQVSGAC